MTAAPTIRNIRDERLGDSGAVGAARRPLKDLLTHQVASVVPEFVPVAPVADVEPSVDVVSTGGIVNALAVIWAWSASASDFPHVPLEIDSPETATTRRIDSSSPR